jgi:hypothetical protein
MESEAMKPAQRRALIAARRQGLSRDDRFNWRDEAMPVIRNYKFINGQCKTEIDPDYERRYREHMMSNADYPNWRSDPTYNLRRK